MSDSLQPHEMQHTRPPCPSSTPGVYQNSYPLSWWCHPIISSFVIPFSSCPQSFWASGSFQVSQFFTSGVQSIAVSASTSVLPMNTQDWSPLWWTGLISLQSIRWWNDSRDILTVLSESCLDLWIHGCLWPHFKQIGCCSVTQSCLTHDHMDCSPPTFPVLHHLLELAQTHVHWVSDASKPSQPRHPFISCFQSFPTSRSFLMSQLFTSSGQGTGVSASAQSFQWIFRTDLLYDWLVGCPCSPRDSQESSITPQFKSINSSVLSFLYSPNLTSIHDYWKNQSFD